MKITRFLIVFSALLCCSTVLSQDKSIWTSAETKQKNLLLKKGATDIGYKLNVKNLKTKLKNSPKRSESRQRKVSDILIDFPVAANKYGQFRVVESNVLNEELAKKYPDIKSYVGVSVENPLKRIYFSVDALGFHGMILDGNKRTYINPTKNQKDTYYLAQKSDFKSPDFQCKVISNKGAMGSKDNKTNTSLKPVDDSQLRTYRLALACTGEYAQFQIAEAGLTNGTTAQQKAAVLSAMNTTITRVNSVYENDLAITLQLIANDDEIVFLDPDTDGLTNNNSETIINDEIQDLIDAAIGPANYDIGHVFTKTTNGGDGIAQVASVCTSTKARGVTGYESPVGDPFDIDYVSHEMGHQFGATHTFNNSCNSNRSAATSVEPGSGSTIMGYAGICPNDVQGNSDAYFHAISISQIWDNITAGNSTCASTSTLNNQAPVIASLNNYTIPAGTPFALDASVTDVDGDMLTYCWEQQNNEVSVQPPQPDAEGGPMFRSKPPSLSSKRYFPEKTAILNNDLASMWEVVPTVSRNLNFSLLVRDNNAEGGQTARADLTVHTIDTGNEFAVTSQNTPQSLQGGSVYTINWNVADTDELPIGTGFVDIYLIIDNNFENLVSLAQNTKNDGVKQVVIPGDITTANARIMVKAVDNIYFALNEAVLEIQPSNFALIFNTLEHNVCQPDNRDIPFTYNAYNGFNQTVTFTAEDVPSGLTVTFDQTQAYTSGTVITASLSGSANLSLGTNNFTIVATASGGEIKEYPIELSIYSSTFNLISLNSPANNAIEIPLNTILSWAPYNNASAYEIEVSEAPDFSAILLSDTISINQFQPTNLEELTTYYWHIKPINDCGEGTFSNAFSFTTVNITCESFTSNANVAISSTGSNSASATLNINEQGIINSATVTVDISHTWMEDLTIYLISPSGTTITLLAEQCGDRDNIQATFTDEGNTLICSNSSPTISGDIKPNQPLAGLMGKLAKGTWRLQVDDSNDGDGGNINSFTLNLCVNGDFQPDTDNDGVLDSNDNCPNTPQGTKVDVHGCEVFSVAENNYTISVTDQPCIGDISGTVTIETAEAHNYTAILTGNGLVSSNPFTQNTEFTDLPTGAYELCFYVDENNEYQQCFNINIHEPQPLTVFSSKNKNGNSVSLELSGSDLYVIELNGVISKTNRENVELSLKKGINTLKVSTHKNCQGTYQELIVTPGSISVYPNAFQDRITIYTGLENGNNNISLFDATGRLIKSMKYEADYNGKVKMNLGDLTSGMYLMQVKNQLGSNTMKIIKQ